MGYDGVEFAGYYGKTADEINQLLTDTGLGIAGSHVPYEHLREALDETLDFEKAIGNTRVVVPFASFQILEGWEGFANDLNRFSHSFAQSGFIDGAYLLKQYDAVARQPYTLRIKLNVGRQSRLAGLARYRSSNNRWAVFIAGVVLNDQNGSHPALLRAHNGAQVGIIYISALDYTQFNSHSE